MELLLLVLIKTVFMCSLWNFEIYTLHQIFIFIFFFYAFFFVFSYLWRIAIPIFYLSSFILISTSCLIFFLWVFVKLFSFFFIFLCLFSTYVFLCLTFFGFMLPQFVLVSFSSFASRNCLILSTCYNLFDSLNVYLFMGEHLRPQ